jgi:hypothetical protein
MVHTKTIKVRSRFDFYQILTRIIVNMAQLPALNENQTKKLKLLSIATLSESQQVGFDTDIYTPCL